MSIETKSARWHNKIKLQNPTLTPKIQIYPLLSSVSGVTTDCQWDQILYLYPKFMNKTVSVTN